MEFATKTVDVCGRRIPITGSDADPYFRSIDAFAAQLGPLHRFVRERAGGGVVLDVGANIGLTSLAMTLAAPGAPIVAFEPSPANIRLFEANTRGHRDIRLERRGVADREGSLDFVIPDAGANCHVATVEYEYAGNPNFHPLSVPITTIDTYCASALADQQVSIVKIDVEGFEPNVLAGARNMIARWRPAIWMEFNSVTLNVAQGYSPMAFAKALFDCFEVLRIEGDGGLRAIPSASALVHDNITLHGSVEDVVLFPRPGTTVPDVESMTLPRSVSSELRRLRAARS